MALFFGNPLYGDGIPSKILKLIPDGQTVDEIRDGKVYAALCWAYVHYIPDSAEVYGDKGLELAREIGNEDAVAKCENCLGYLKGLRGDFELAITYLNQSLKYFLNSGNFHEAGLGQLHLGLVYYQQGNYIAALEKYSQALAYGQKYQLPTLNFKSLLSIAKLYRKKGDIDSGLEYLNEAEGIATSEPLLNGMLYKEKSIFFSHRSESDSALKYASHALYLFENEQDKKEIALANLQIGEIYADLEDYDMALHYHAIALDILEDLGIRKEINKALNNLAGISLGIGNFRAAADFALRGLEISNLLQLKEYQMHTNLLLSQAMAELWDFDRAYQYHIAFSKHREEYINEQTLKNLLEVRAKYELEKKEKEKEAIIANSEVEKQKAYQIYLIICLIAIAVIVVLLVLGIISQRRHNQKLLQQYCLIAQQNNKIKVMNQTLEGQNSHLERLNAEKDSAIKVVTHDLKAPLDRILGLIQIMDISAGDMSMEQKSYLEKIKQVIGEGTETVKKLLDIRALEEGSIILRMEKVSVQEVLQELLANYQPLAHKKDITLQFENKACDGYILADKFYLTRVFDNLISNAIKFSFANSTIKIWTENRGEDIKDIVVAFQDMGPGLDKEDMGKLFLAYERLKPRPTGGESSTGLGLVAVKQLVEKLQGKVWCESQVNQGATFLVSFPVAVGP